MLLIRCLLLLCLLCSTKLYAALCSDIWTQAIRANSSVPASLTLPATTNPTFPEPLQPIDYYYSGAGSYVIGNNLVRTTTGATTRLFINGNLTLENNAQLNAGGPPQNLIIVVSGNLVLNNNVVINGFVLVGGAAQLYNNVVINGALTAKGGVGNFAGTVNYRPEAIPFLVGGIVCEAGQQTVTLLAHYPLDLCPGAASSVIEDLSGKYPASGVNVAAQPLGKVLEAADLSAAAADYISVPAAALNGLNNFTLSLWFKLTGGSGFRELISASGSSTDSELELYINGSNELRAALKGTYYSFSGGSVSAVVTNNVWYQLTLTRSGSNLCLYLNNNLVQCVSASATSLSVARAAIGIWWRANGTTSDDFRGDIDEVLLFNQALTTTQIQQMYSNQQAGRSYDGTSRTSKCPQIDHFEFDYSGQALTCKPETFALRACKNASCTELVTTNISATLTPANGGNVNWLGGNSISFSGGQTTVALRRTTVGATTIGIVSAAPVSQPTLCRAGNGALSAAACSVSFADSGLVFDVPDGVANQPQQNVLVSAVRKDAVSQQCVPEFANVSRNIAFWSDYITPGPGGRVASAAITVNGQAIAQTQAQASQQSLNFNAQGQAAVTVNYSDAGRVQLNARYSGSAATGDSGLLMSGADQFVRRPVGLCIQTGGECASADRNCSKFAIAAAPFTLKITAHRFENNGIPYCNNPVTPSFSHSAIALSHTLVAPGGGNAGVLSATSYNHQLAVNSENSVAQSVSEVGVFRFHTAAVNYLGMADAVPAASSAATGRFVPASFALTPGLPVAACGSFSYFAQPSFSTAFSVQARNGAGQRTENYQGDFARLNVQQWSDSSASTGLRFSAPDLPAGAVLTQGALAPVGNWLNGEAQLIATHIASRPLQPAAPLALTVYAQPVDSDNVSVATPVAITSNSTELRYGRLVLANVAGPEEAPLPLKFSSEYFDGSRFVHNLADNCTVVGASPALLSTRQGTPSLLLSGSSSTLQQGRLPAQQIWLAPTNKTGSWQIEYQTDPWLQYYWRGSSADYQQNPQADVMFGRFRGNPRQISWRELFQ